jgi:cobyrinic acid a,c-diamide synthase
MAELPRLMVAGLAGDTGKSLVALGLARALRDRDLSVAPFKKGPDFIDAAWLGAAAGAPGRNLDSFIMPRDAILGSLGRTAQAADVAVIEGNRGLFDGLDAAGSHSSAQLARLIGAPVVLVLDVTKVTATSAALVKGCCAMDPQLDLVGVILNRVGTHRQERVIREAIVNATGLPVLGAIPRLGDQHLPSRHLGLVTAVEHPQADEALERVAEAVSRHTDVDRLLDLARERSAPIEAPADAALPAVEPRVSIGVLSDRAFSFYYPENLEALEAAGAELVRISAIDDHELPEIDALYAGGGFPEIHAEELSANASLRETLARRIADGLPVWAECGGLMYLSRAVVMDGVEHPMVGALPVTVEHSPRPQGHGYVEGRVDSEAPFLPAGLELRGHEFHYSRVRENGTPFETVFDLQRGIGVGDGRDGIRVGQVVAAYTHLHALGAPDWATGLVAAAGGRHG